MVEPVVSSEDNAGVEFHAGGNNPFEAEAQDVQDQDTPVMDGAVTGDGATNTEVRVSVDGDNRVQYDGHMEVESPADMEELSEMPTASSEAGVQTPERAPAV